MSTPLATCLRACFAFPASAATSMPRSCALAMTSGGGGPSAFAISPAGRPSATSTCLRAVGPRRYPEPEQRLLDEVLVGLRDQLGEVLLPALGRDQGRHDYVDAVRAPVGVLVHPVQARVQFGRVVEPDAAQHAEAAGPADRGGDVLRRGESDDGVLDAEQVAQDGLHGAARR